MDLSVMYMFSGMVGSFLGGLMGMGGLMLPLHAHAHPQLNAQHTQPQLQVPFLVAVHSNVSKLTS